MGKKRVVTKGGDAASKSAGGSPQKSKSKSKARKVEHGRVYIQASYNNTLVSITDTDGNMLAASSAGKLGFRGPKKATPYAATQIVESLGDAIGRFGIKEVDVYVKGIGSGRESAIRALPTHGLTITSLTDITPMAFNGPRAKKPRRV